MNICCFLLNINDDYINTEKDAIRAKFGHKKYLGEQKTILVQETSCPEVKAVNL